LQLRHAPSQALSQQMPSTQKPDTHWSALVQDCPLLRWPQMPATAPATVVAVHACPGSQESGLFGSQLVWHAPAEHRNGAQSTISAGLQIPLPSQVRGALSTKPEHAEAPQMVFSGNRLQPPKPSHSPLLPQVDGSVA
jgi:hypothetical protein